MHNGDSKPRYELSLACAIADGGHILAVPLPLAADEFVDPQMVADLEAEVFAQAVVIHETGDSVYTYTFHLIEHLAHEPVQLETVYLTTHIEQVHADYGEFATEISDDE